METNRSCSICLCIFMFLISHFYLHGQDLKARIDQVLHQSAVTEMVVSLDRKFFATADDRVILFRDVETGKVISHHTFPHDIADLHFTTRPGELLVLLEKDRHVELVIFDFINMKATKTESFMGFDDDYSGVDFHPETNAVFIFSENHIAYYFNYLTDFNKNLNLEHALISASFNSSGQVEILNVDAGGSVSISEYIYNPVDDQLIQRNRDFESFYMDLDLSNKRLIARKDSLIFEDFILGKQLVLSNRHFINPADADPDSEFIVSNVQDFAFSPDGAHLAVVGGDGTHSSRESSGGAITEVEQGTGYICMVDVAKKRLRWKTKNKANQVQFDVNDLGWISNESVLITDEKGETQEYHISESEYQNAYPLPENIKTSLHVDDSFNRILYSPEMQHSYAFDVKAENPVSILSSKYSTYLDISENLLMDYAFLAQTAPYLNDNIFGLAETFEQPEMIGEISDARLSRSGNYVSVCSGPISFTMTSRKQVINPAPVKDDQGNIIGLKAENKIVYMDNLSASDFSDDPNSTFEYSLNSCMSVINLLNSADRTTIRTKTTNVSQFSFDERYISFSENYDGPETRIFDLRKKQWKYFNNNTTTALAYNYFDQYSSLSFSYLGDNNYIIWNTSDDSILFQGSLDPSNLDESVFSQALAQDPTAQSVSSMRDKIFWMLGSNAQKMRFLASDNELIILISGSLVRLDYTSGKMSFVKEQSNYLDFDISKDGQFLYTLEYGVDVGESKITNIQNDQIIYQKPFMPGGSKYMSGGARFEKIYFHKNNSLAFVYDSFGSLDLVDLKNEKLLATLKLFKDGNWLVYTPDGIFDASKEGRDALYYVKGTDIILFNELKGKFWEPQLLDKLINTPDVVESDALNKKIELYPLMDAQFVDVNNQVITSDTATTIEGILLDLTERSGGIGRVSLFINDKEVNEDINPNLGSQIRVSLLDHKHRFFEAGLNKIAFKAYNKTGWLSSRPLNMYFETSGSSRDNDGEKPAFKRSKKRKSNNSNLENKPGLFGLFIGSSKYKNNKLDLKYADKDAHDFKDALLKISEGMYEPERVHLKVLVSESNSADSLSTKNNIHKAFKFIADNAKPTDIIVLFFSGHGMTLDDDFYYLTSLAGNIDLTQDVAGRADVTFSSKEINEALRNISSNKQVMVLDACHSGQITKIFEGASKATTTSQKKALEDLEDKMGLFVLASSESNQKSFETERLEQGLLTFSLINGMSGAAADAGSILVTKLLSFASDETERIGKEILGRSQRPVLGISNGGNTFPLGFENEALKIPLPSSKILIGEPKFGIMPVMNDPANLQTQLTTKLKERGSIGSTEPFTYVSQSSDPDIIKVSGTYKRNNGNFEVQWYLLKKQEVWKGPINETIPDTDMKVVVNTIINKTLELAKTE